MAETHTYSHADIQRYLQRQMSPQDMHNFERALMNDPFLADALDGYTTANLTVTQEHLTEIEIALRKEKQPAKVVPLARKQTAWWKVAAIILVIVSAGWLTFGLFSKDEIINQPSIAAAPAAKDIIQHQDTVRAIDKPIASIDILPKKETFYKRKNVTSQPESETSLAPPSISLQQATADTTAILQRNELANDLVVVGNGSARRSITRNEVLSGKVAGLEEAMPKEFKGKVLDAMGEPMPFASVKAKNKNTATIADSKGNFTILSRDSVLNIDVSSPGYVTTNKKLKVDSTTNNVVLEETEKSLSEIVVTDMARRKKGQSARAIIDLNAIPEGGWKRFEQYVTSRADSLKETEGYNLDEESVVLEFTIDKDGRPINIKAPEKVDKKALKHAILILANGPKWKMLQKEKKVKVTIKF